MALASLLAQSYMDWECVLVDDGSSDRPEEIVECANDRRIRFLRLERNMGRGVARQVALDTARGELIAWLDADDWYYPCKLEKQTDAMQHDTTIGILSAGMAILDRSNCLAGIRARARSFDGDSVTSMPMNRPAMPPLAFPPSMVRSQIAREVGFDPAFHLSQDADFLLKILFRESYCLLPDVLYGYTEYQTVSLEKVLRQSGFVRQMFRKHQTEYPWTCKCEITKSLAKSMVYRLAFNCGLKDRLIQRRSTSPTAQDLRSFQTAYNHVVEKCRLVFGDHVHMDV
jgi:glycosyltransferase involved in cell wall biosynthesis